MRTNTQSSNKQLICFFLSDEKVDEDTFKQLTESQILRMQKNMNMGTQTKLMAKQRSMNKVKALQLLKMQGFSQLKPIPPC